MTKIPTKLSWVMPLSGSSSVSLVIDGEFDIDDASLIAEMLSLASKSLVRIAEMRTQHTLDHAGG